jgi:hypothetical protein
MQCSPGQSSYIGRRKEEAVPENQNVRPKWWEPSDLDRIGRSHLSDFFGEHLVILEGVASTLADISGASQGVAPLEERIEISRDTVDMLSWVMGRAIFDLRDRFDMVDKKIRAALAGNVDRPTRAPVVDRQGSPGTARRTSPKGNGRRPVQPQI